MKYSAFALLLLALDPLARAADKPLEILSRLELFVDDLEFVLDVGFGQLRVLSDDRQHPAAAGWLPTKPQKVLTNASGWSIMKETLAR